VAHGTPDWWSGAPKETTYGLADMAELAARLGSPVKWDRRGDVVHVDTFEGGFALGNTYGYGTNHAEFLSPDYSREGGLSCCLYPGSTSNKMSGIHYVLPRPPYSKMGVEFSFGLNSDALYWVLMIDWYTGATHYQAQVRYDYPNSQMDYYNSAGVWVSFAKAVSRLTTPFPVHTMKLVVDFVNFLYHRCIFNQQTWDLSAYAIRATASTVSPSFTTDMQVWATTGAYQYHYLDNVIITQNEP